MLREGSPCAPATSCLSPHPLSQAAAVPLASWYRMGTVCLCLLAAAASPAPTLPGRWPRLRWCGWTAETGTNALQWPHGDGELWVGGSSQLKVMGHCWGAKAVHPDSRGSEPFLHTPAPSTCVNGSLACSSHECPTLGPWSAWSNCSAPCGGGTTKRHRSCKEGPGVAPCQTQDTEQRQDCNLQPCPGECPGWWVPAQPGACPEDPPWTPPHSLLPLHPQSAHLARCSVPALSRAHASVLICSLAPPACRNPASLAVTAPEGRWVWVLCPDSRVGDQAGGGAGVVVTCNSNLPCLSCCTTARVCPLPSARAPSCLCPGASP